MDHDGRPSSLYDGDATEESRRNTRRALYFVLGAAALVAAIATVSVLVVRNGSTDEATVPGSDTAAASTVAPADPELIERVTEQGLVVRLRTVDAGFVDSAGLPAGAPAWCMSAGMASATVISPVAVAQTQFNLSEQAHPNGAGLLFVGGQIEGAPVWGVVVQVPPEVVLVRAVVPGAPSDEMVPVDGVAVVGMVTPRADEGGAASTVAPLFPVFGPNLVDMTIEFVTITGRKVRKVEEMMGPPMWSDPKCWWSEQPPPTVEPPPPPELPPAGEQPPDPVAAQAEATGALVALFTEPVEEGRQFFELIDDASGIDISVAELTENGPELVDRLSNGNPKITAFVFISPVEAFFYYDLAIGYDVLIDRLGRARFVDGRWKITRGTFCQEVTMYGVYCGP